MSRGKNTTQTSTYGNGTSDNAVDGNYNNTDLEQCATLLHPSTIRSSLYYATWQVDLGGLYAIASVTIYNTAVMPGISCDCYYTVSCWFANSLPPPRSLCILGFCMSLCVCRWDCKISQKVTNGFWWNFLERWSVAQRPIAFWRRSDSDASSGSRDF